MAKAEINVEYPCGYKFNLKADVGIFGDFHIDDSDYKTCPLHGKNCSKKGKR